MTKTECENRKWPHNQRCRYSHGFLCEDCGEFFPKDSATYIRYELPSTISMVVWNIGVEYSRAGKEVPAEIKSVGDKLDKVTKDDNAKRREDVLNEALRLIARYKKTPESATMLLA